MTRKTTCSWLLGAAGALVIASCVPQQPAVAQNGVGASPSGGQASGAVDHVAQVASANDRVASTPPADAWWDEPYPTAFDATHLPTSMSRLRVKGNHFENEGGQTVVVRGVNIADPDKLQQTGHFNRHLFEVIRDWGANVVRIPVHPLAWRQRGASGYFALLDQAITWANEMSLYVIVDWHSMGNLKSELFQHRMYRTTLQESLEFWRDVAFRYRGVSTVAFYELFNEPTLRNGTLGEIKWEQWKAINEEAISIIRAHDAQVIPLVAGFNWAYDLTPVASAPIAKDGIAYVVHPYPMKTTAPFEANWEKVWGFVANKYPLVATEIGYMGEHDKGAHRPAIDDGSYGPRITDYLSKKGASWTAWCFDPDWAPQLLKDWDFTPTPSGEYFRKVMQDSAAKRAAR